MEGFLDYLTDKSSHYIYLFKKESNNDLKRNEICLIL